MAESRITVDPSVEGEEVRAVVVRPESITTVIDTNGRFLMAINIDTPGGPAALALYPVCAQALLTMLEELKAVRPIYFEE